MPTAAKKGLGKGLAAILQTEVDEERDLTQIGFIPDLDIEKISPNPKQPRSNIDPEELVGLADSIREYGIIEPLIVTKTESGDYMLIAGERRWRASKLAQLKAVPVIVKEATTQQLLEMAIIENIQRKDLNPLEEATALAELYNNYNIRMDEIARKIGRDVGTVSNKMRLLKLPEQAKQGLLERKITESHAYILLSLKSSDALLAAYNIAAKKGLSVAQTDQLVRKISLANKEVFPVSPLKQNSVIYDEKTAAVEETLRATLGKKFKLIRRRNGGQVVVPFLKDEQLEALTKFLTSAEFTRYIAEQKTENDAEKTATKTVKKPSK